MRHMVTAAGPWEYFLRKVRIGKPCDCWEWMGSCGTPGYGNWGMGGQKAAHRATYILFNGTINRGSVVRHTCDNRKCCNPDHLVIGTRSDNSSDMVKRGRSAKGESHSQVKLTEDDVREIRVLIRKGAMCKDIAPLFAVTPTCVSHIKRGNTWGWLV